MKYLYSLILLALVFLLQPSLANADELSVNDQLEEAGNRIIEHLDAGDLKGNEIELRDENMELGEENFTSKGEYCDELLRQVDTLSGKPLRRSAMRDRFDLECGSKGHGQSLRTMGRNPDFN